MFLVILGYYEVLNTRKASELISCRAVLDRSTSVKATQSSNACPPISFKEAGNATEANFWLPEKA